MTNAYFTGGSVPSTRSPGTSSAIRAEFARVSSAFDKLPTLSGGAGAPVRVNAGATAMEVVAAPAGALYYNGASGMTGSSGLAYDTNGKLTVAAASSGHTLDIGGTGNFAGKVTVGAAPTNPLDVATKAYVDGVATGLTVKAACRVATTANITLSGAQTIDGVSAIAGDRVLVKNQSTGSQNGVYVVAAGAWSRATDADISAEVPSGTFVFVTSGTLNGNTGWTLSTPNPITLGTTSLTFAQYSGGATYSNGTGLTLSGSQFSITNTGVTAAGYGSATSVATFTVNAQGQLTLAGSATIALNAGTHITSGTLASARLSGTYGIDISGNAATATNGLTTGNYTSYAPTLTGGGASGTWGINVTGNAATATNATNATNAGNATTVGGYAPSSGTGGNTIGLRNSSGYLYAYYFNQSSPAENPTAAHVWVESAGDGFFRKMTRANFFAQAPNPGSMPGVTIQSDPGGTPSGSAGQIFFYY